MASLAAWSVDRLGAGFRDGSISPVQVMRVLLDEIEQDAFQDRAFCWIDAESAMAMAQMSEKRYRTGQPLGSMDGIPISIKDLVDVAGWPTRRGSRACVQEPVAAEDAPAVAALRRSGAVLYGKTTTTEFGWQVGSSNPLTGVTINPRAPGHSVGGSSSGAAAHLALGWGPVALGSDAGGSVRIPASYTGLVGFKPTWGAIPMPALSAFAELAHLGPMARSVSDCQHAFMALSVPDQLDPSSLYLRRTEVNLSGLRVGYALNFNTAIAPQQVIARTFDGLIERLPEIGIQPLQIEWTQPEVSKAMWTLWASRVYESFIAWPPTRQSLLGEDLQRVAALGARLSLEQLALSRLSLRVFAQHLHQLFTDIDILLTPATATTAPPQASSQTHDPRPVQGDDNWFARHGYAYPFNLTQQPALVLPLGQDAQDKPFGLQLVARKYDDARLLAFAAQVEALLAGSAA